MIMHLIVAWYLFHIWYVCLALVRPRHCNYLDPVTSNEFPKKSTDVTSLLWLVSFCRIFVREPLIFWQLCSSLIYSLALERLRKIYTMTRYLLMKQFFLLNLIAKKKTSQITIENGVVLYLLFVKWFAAYVFIHQVGVIIIIILM